ncbi:MAG: GNAT family N-acetyltransferase, partial [Cyanobacteria bacterium P01_A01_bin.105]
MPDAKTTGHAPPHIRSVHFGDLDKLVPANGTEVVSSGQLVERPQALPWRLPLWKLSPRLLVRLPNPLPLTPSAYVAEAANQVCGLIQVSPFNSTRSTWRVERVAVKSGAKHNGQITLDLDLASQLLRHCFEKIYEAHTWISETDINDKFGLALYRQNGFQPLAHVTYWSISPAQLSALAEHEPDLPNLLPISNADAQLIYQLETVSMPPLVRQVFDHQIQDFRTTGWRSLFPQLGPWMRKTELVSAYVFEPQRKAAIGYFKLRLSRGTDQPHVAKLTVHPAYTWLYPELMAQMAQVIQSFPERPLRLSSLDYQPEREAYLNRIEATEVEHTVMMSRSVWHKVRESKAVTLEGLHLPDVLQGLQPTGKPIPGRFSWQGPINGLGYSPVDYRPTLPDSMLPDPMLLKDEG